MYRIAEPVLNRLLGNLHRRDQFVFLDTSRPDGENSQSLLFISPVDRLVCHASDDLGEFLSRLQLQLARGYYLAGWVGYEFGAILEGGLDTAGRSSNGEDIVVADLGVFHKPLRFDHQSGESEFPPACSSDNGLQDEAYGIDNLQPNMSREEFVSSLHRVQDYIAAGDTYQVNYTMKLYFDFHGSVEKLYSHLRKNQSVGYGAFIRSGEENILSFSPELFFKKSGAEITVRPMKGTAERGNNLQEEKQQSSYLHNDGKNRSENVMIVDLLRNDLARLMHGHGKSRVFVDSLFDVESYESLLQMTSTVKATTAAETMQSLPLTELFRALFPSGSITGAPKIRTMQIIDELEKAHRGVYTGAIGYFGPEGSAAFNVPIRTIRLSGNKGEMGIGAGITHGSVAEEEWDESLLKGRFLTHPKPDFQLFETILYLPDTGYYLLDEHLQRLQQGAEYFKFSCDSKKIRDVLVEKSKNFKGGGRRVRLELYKDGRFDLESAHCARPRLLELPANPLEDVTWPQEKIRLSAQIVDTDNPWRFHKTTRRELYNSEYQRARESGFFDTIFYNDREEITEGCITNLIIYSDGVYITPPVSSGLLPGVMRQKLMNDPRGSLREKVINSGDLQSADAIYLCNSVRGVVRVRLED